MMTTRKAVLAILIGGLVIGLSSLATAEITTQKDAANFNRYYDGADLLGSDWSGVNSPDGTAVGSDGTGTGTYLKFVTHNVSDTYYSWGQSLPDSVGWTIELCYKITTAESVGTRVFDLMAGDGGTNQENIMYFASGDISWFGGAILKSDDFTDDFHTMRIAEAANSGDGDTHVWVDGALVADDLGTSYEIIRLWVGDLGGGAKDGVALIQYVSVHTAGAFAPVAIPEPSTLMLMLLGAAAIMLRRRFRRN